jgi:hypothetical protein
VGDNQFISTHQYLPHSTAHAVTRHRQRLEVQVLHLIALPKRTAFVIAPGLTGSKYGIPGGGLIPTFLTALRAYAGD